MYAIKKENEHQNKMKKKKTKTKNTYQKWCTRHWPTDLPCHSYIDWTVRTSGRSRELLDQLHTIPDAV